MRRTASEVIRNLEARVARLEKSSTLNMDEKAWFRLGGLRESGTRRGYYSSLYHTKNMDIEVICKKVQSEFKEKLAHALSNKEVDSLIASLFRPLLRIAKVFKKYGEGEIVDIYVRKIMGDSIELFFNVEGLSDVHYKRAKVEITEKQGYATIKKKEHKVFPFRGYSILQKDYDSYPFPEEERIKIEYNPLKGLLTANNPDVLKRTTAQLIENKFKKMIEEKQTDFESSILAPEVKKWVLGLNMKDKIEEAEGQATSMLAFYEEVVEDYDGEFPLPHKDYEKHFDYSSYLDPEDAEEAWFGLVDRAKRERFDALLEYVEHKVDYSDLYSPRILVLFKVDPSFKDYGQSVPSSEWEINDMTPPSKVESCLVEIKLTKSGRPSFSDCDTMSNNKRYMDKV